MYYTIKKSTGKEIGSVFPQVTCLTQELAHSIKFTEFVNFDTELLFALQPGAILTDVLSQAAISANGLLISQRLKVLLDKFQLMPHKFYRTAIVTMEGQKIYYWLHFVDNSYKDKIDYDRSVFYWTKSTFKKDIIKLASYDEYLELKKQNGILWGVKAEKIELNQFFDKHLDMFSCLPFDLGIYISAKLYDVLLQEKITGINIKESELLN
jgi:hypothetical protein